MISTIQLSLLVAVTLSGRRQVVAADGGQRRTVAEQRAAGNSAVLRTTSVDQAQTVLMHRKEYYSTETGQLTNLTLGDDARLINDNSLIKKQIFKNALNKRYFKLKKPMNNSKQNNIQTKPYDYVKQNGIPDDAEVLQVSADTGVEFGVPTDESWMFTIVLKSEVPRYVVTVLCRFTDVSVAVYFQGQLRASLSRNVEGAVRTLKYRFTSHNSVSGLLEFDVLEAGGTVNCDASAVDAANHNCECGRPLYIPPSIARVMGGFPTPGHAYPWQASLIERHPKGNIAYLCGAAVISSKWILTAAHCVSPVPYTDESQFRVFVGSPDLVQGGSQHRVRRMVVHPRYDEDTVSNDIALLEIEGKLDLTRPPRGASKPGVVQAVCLPKPGRAAVSDNTAATVAGWGITSEDKDYPSQLQEATLHTLSLSRCKKLYEEEYSRIEKQNSELIIWNVTVPRHSFNRHRALLPPSLRMIKNPLLSNKVLCANDFHTSASSCQGDSGGALFMEAPEGRVVQVGVVSWGGGCGDPTNPGVYTRVDKYIGWIMATAGTEEACLA